MSRKLTLLNTILLAHGKSKVKEYPEGLPAIRKDLIRYALLQDDAPVSKPVAKPKKVEAKVEKKEE